MSSLGMSPRKACKHKVPANTTQTLHLQNDDTDTKDPDLDLLLKTSPKLKATIPEHESLNGSSLSLSLPPIESSSRRTRPRNYKRTSSKDEKIFLEDFERSTTIPSLLSNSKRGSRRFWFVALLIVCVLMVVMLYVVETEEGDKTGTMPNMKSLMGSVSIKNKKQVNNNLRTNADTKHGDDGPVAVGADTTKSRVKKTPTPVWTGPDYTIDKMLENFATSRQALVDQLMIDYGAATFDKMFSWQYCRVDMQETGESWNRLKRKLKMKLLKLLLKQEQSSFVWGTGGHSIAAAHGNLYNQSYTAYMERAAGKVFEAVGIDFTTRNYAMGGEQSAPKMAACIDEIFGLDLDFLLWDFSMMDQSRFWKLAMYVMRAGINPGRPAVGGFELTGGDTKKIFEDVHDMGLASFQFQDKTFRQIQTNVPNTLGKTQEEIDAMPEYVKYFKCGKLKESGDPGCGDHKYDDSICPDRAFKASWHPGWKWMAMAGNWMGLFLIEVLRDALEELRDVQDMQSLLDELKASEDRDYEKFAASQNPKYAHSGTKDIGRAMPLNLPDDFPDDLMFREPNFCHTSELPAEIRNLGILTETGSFDQGIWKDEADANPLTSDGPMRLVQFDERDHQSCPVVLNRDQRDGFYVPYQNEVWSSLELPNDSEFRTYGPNRSIQGYLVVCTKAPSEGSKLGNDMVYNFDLLKYADMFVNGVPVTRISTIGKDEDWDSCAVWGNENGSKWTPNENGKLKIKVRVKEEGHFLAFSGFIICMEKAARIHKQQMVQANRALAAKEAAARETTDESDDDANATDRSATEDTDDLLALESESHHNPQKKQVS